MNMGPKIHCRTCGTTIQSKHVHDYVSCECLDERTRIAVDGGGEYLRMSIGDEATWHSVRGEDE